MDTPIEVFVVYLTMPSTLICRLKMNIVLSTLVVLVKQTLRLCAVNENAFLSATVPQCGYLEHFSQALKRVVSSFALAFIEKNH